jgi:hypothetical protein
MSWRRKADDHESLATALKREQLRQQHRDLKQQNDAQAKADYIQQRKTEDAWQRKPWYLRPAPPDPTFKINKQEDGVRSAAARASPIATSTMCK